MQDTRERRCEKETVARPIEGATKQTGWVIHRQLTTQGCAQRWIAGPEEHRQTPDEWVANGGLSVAHWVHRSALPPRWVGVQYIVASTIDRASPSKLLQAWHILAICARPPRWVQPVHDTQSNRPCWTPSSSTTNASAGHPPRWPVRDRKQPTRSQKTYLKTPQTLQKPTFHTHLQGSNHPPKIQDNPKTLHCKPSWTR